MGTGSSKRRDSETVVVNASLESKESEVRKKQENLPKTRTENSNMEIEDHIGNEANTAVKISDETSRNENTSAGNNNDVKEDNGDIKEDTAKLETLSQEVSVSLSFFCEKYPDIKVLLTSTAVSFQGLKEALDSENMASADNVHLAKRLCDSYLKCKKRSNKAGLTDFALKLGIPKFVCDIVTHVRTQYPELTKWDRGKQNAEQKESEPTPDADHEESGEEDKAEDDKAKGLNIVQDVINNLGSAVLNFTDLHDQFCVACGEHGMVSLFIEMVKDLKDAVAENTKFVNPETQRLTKYTARGRMLSRLLGALHNLSKRVQVRSMFLSCEAVDVLIPLLKAEVTLFATKALLVLAYLIDEQNNHVIMADEGPIKFLTNALDKSLKFSHHRYLGFSAAELAEGLTQIAVNDSNKKTIAHCGAIPVLAKMLITAKENQERINGCSTLWTLAFDADNRVEIRSNEHALAELRKLASHENMEIRKAAAGALWEVEGKHKHAEENYRSNVSEEVTDTKHIMISYQWDVQSSMIQLKNRLQADGYKVWMDIDQMGGSTLESMAKAVEDATVVLIGVSQKYKESPNCRSEAEYTFQLHKDIIPLMMEKRYQPDGWLGMVVGTKFWIDCSDKHKLDTSMDRLKKELGSRGNLTTQDTVKVASADTVDAAPGLSISTWTHHDARDWLMDLGLHGRMDPTALKRLDGAMLIRLQDLRKESPEFFFSSIAKEFALTSLFDVLEFTDALDNLVG